MYQGSRTDEYLIEGRPCLELQIFLHFTIPCSYRVKLTEEQGIMANPWGNNEYIAQVRLNFGRLNGDPYMLYGYYSEPIEMRKVVVKGDELKRKFPLIIN